MLSSNFNVNIELVINDKKEFLLPKRQTGTRTFMNEDLDTVDTMNFSTRPNSFMC